MDMRFLSMALAEASSSGPVAAQVAAGALLAAAGLALLALGWRAYRVLLVAVGVFATGLLVARLVERAGVLAMLAAGVPAGVFGGLLTNRFERYGVFFLGGAASATLVLFHADYFMSNHTMYFSAVLCFLLTGSLAVLFWKPGIILSMCVLGATFAERGTLIVLDTFRPGMALYVAAQHNLAMTTAFLCLVLAGILVQYRVEPAEEAE